MAMMSTARPVFFSDGKTHRHEPHNWPNNAHETSEGSPAGIFITNEQRYVRANETGATLSCQPCVCSFLGFSEDRTPHEKDRSPLKMAPRRLEEIIVSSESGWTRRLVLISLSLSLLGVCVCLFLLASCRQHAACVVFHNRTTIPMSTEASRWQLRRDLIIYFTPADYSFLARTRTSWYILWGGDSSPLLQIILS
jgi:hypothetical protein